MPIFSSQPPQDDAAQAVGDRLFDELLFIGWDRVGLHDSDGIVVELENIRRESHAYRVTLTPITVYKYPHNTLVELENTLLPMFFARYAVPVSRHGPLDPLDGRVSLNSA